MVCFSVNISEIKEIRPGKVSRDFERLQDEARKVDSLVCFSIFYGTEFNLKVLSVAGLSKFKYGLVTIIFLINLSFENRL